MLSAFFQTRIRNEDAAIRKKPFVVILAPAVVLRNWTSELKKWLPDSHHEDMQPTILDSSIVCYPPYCVYVYLFIFIYKGSLFDYCTMNYLNRQRQLKIEQSCLLSILLLEVF